MYVQWGRGGIWYMHVCTKAGSHHLKKKRLCVFSFFGLTSFYLNVFTSFWYQIIALFKSILMVCFIRV